MGSPLPVTFLLMIVSESTNPSVTLLQQHTRKPSVSISPSGEIVEGSSVTLTCSTDGNPPVESYIWYWTDGHFEGPERQSKTIRNETGQTYEIKNVNTGHSGGYRCLPLPGDSESNMVLLEVYYPPRNISVSISPSGEIVEGSSVTLTCSSDTNPPVKIYTWFKDKTEVASEKGQNYRITKISSKGRGEYKCTASNKYGTKDSPVVYMNVLYSPKSVSVSISPSGEIMEGSSVTLTCSSDANPPVKNYTWFKEGGISPVGSGQNYCITNISIEERGRFYCKAQNVIGSQTSPAVSVLEPGLDGGTEMALTRLDMETAEVPSVIYSCVKQHKHEMRIHALQIILTKQKFVVKVFACCSYEDRMQPVEGKDIKISGDIT
ncbi:hypothetical protein NFI96_001616 [Prochilodus magdalenae]|nr:hypothetical protein NFI96_001616 [Prochilodus magdalenae]